MSLSAMPLILRCTKTDHDRSSHDISALSGSSSGTLETRNITSRHLLGCLPLIGDRCRKRTPVKISCFGRAVRREVGVMEFMCCSSLLRTCGGSGRATGGGHRY
jgi:hypothetical protein